MYITRKITSSTEASQQSRQSRQSRQSKSSKEAKERCVFFLAIYGACTYSCTYIYIHTYIMFTNMLYRSPEEEASFAYVSCE